jgi:OOP family OmpA-OmpF porin
MRRLPAFLTLCLIATAANAADNGFYLGAGVGASEFKSGDWVDDSDSGYKLIAGFRLLDSFALEVNYLDFGKGHATVYGSCPSGQCPIGAAPVEATAFSGFAVGFLHFPLLDAFAKLGLASADTKAIVNSMSIKEDTTDVAWGAGVQAHFGSLALRGEFEQYKLKIAGEQDVQLLSISFLYTFL